MANRRDDDQHNDIDNTVLTRVEVLKFREKACDENQQFHEKRQQIIGEIKQMIASFLLGNHLTITMINIFKDVLLTTRKFLSLMEICVSWILLIDFLIWKSILIFGRFVMEKEYGLHLIKWTMKHRNGGKTFKSIESDEVSIQSALGKE